MEDAPRAGRPKRAKRTHPPQAQLRGGGGPTPGAGDGAGAGDELSTGKMPPCGVCLLCGCRCALVHSQINPHFQKLLTQNKIMERRRQ